MQHTIPHPHDLLNLSGKHIVVTGGAQGLGAGIALRLAQAGASITVNYRSSAHAAEQLREQITSLGQRALLVQADVTSAQDVTRLFDAAVGEFGAVDALINNAGIYPLSMLLDMPADEWDAVINANVRSVFLCTQAAARVMQNQPDALNAIVNIASIEGLSPAPAHSHYSAAKAAVIMHTQAAANELGRHGIRVNAVSPGLIWREGIENAWADGVQRWQAAAPLSRLGTAEDVADACLFLVSPAARWITGANLVVDGGVLTRSSF